MTDKCSQLHQACAQDGKGVKIRELLDGGVSVNSVFLDRTPLHTAILNKQREAVVILLDRGANIEARAEGKTPLHRAIENAQSEDLAGLLLDRGASAQAVNDGTGPLDRATTLHFAAFAGLLVIMARLIDFEGLSIEARNNGGATPLFWAATYGKKEALEFLLARGASINALSKDGRTALHWACAYNESECAKILILRGADATIKDNQKKVAFEIYGKDSKMTAESRLLAVSSLLLAAMGEKQLEAAATKRSAHNLPFLSSLLFSDRLSDIVFVCGGGAEHVHAHRCILAARCEQLPWADTGEKEVEISQSGEAVGALLRFMYTGETDAAALDANLQEVLELAALYEQADLKAACEERGLAGLQMKSVVPLLVAAHLHDLGKLKQACMDLIKANAFQVTTSAPFIDLKTTHPLIWTETCAALGLPFDEEKKEDKQRQQQQQQQQEEEKEEEKHEQVNEQHKAKAALVALEEDMEDENQEQQQKAKAARLS